MNYKKHQVVLGSIAGAGFLVLLFTPQYGAAIFLPALGAFVGARKAQSSGPRQPKYSQWGLFFALAAVAVVIRYLIPEENWGGFDAPPENVIFYFIYLCALALAFPLFGYLAYMQRVGRTES